MVGRTLQVEAPIVIEAEVEDKSHTVVVSYVIVDTGSDFVAGSGGSVPCQVGDGFVIVSPGLVDTDTAGQDDVEEVIVRLAESVGQVDEDIEIGADVVKLVGAVVHTASLDTFLGLPSTDLDAGTQRGAEISTALHCADGRQHVFHFITVEYGLSATLYTYKPRGIGAGFGGFSLLCLHRLRNSQGESGSCEHCLYVHHNVSCF